MGFGHKELANIQFYPKNNSLIFRIFVFRKERKMNED